LTLELIWRKVYANKRGILHPLALDEVLRGKFTSNHYLAIFPFAFTRSASIWITEDVEQSCTIRLPDLALTLSLRLQ
jgi:hypothetical protein